MADKGGPLNQLEDTLDLYLVKKAPFQLPSNVKEIIVKFAPWITVVVVVLTLPAILALIGLGAVLTPFTAVMGPAAATSYATSYTISTIVLAVSIILEILAIPGLFSRSIRGWRLVYWSTLISFVSSILTFNIIGGLISAVIGLYFLFQIKSYYK